MSRDEYSPYETETMQPILDKTYLDAKTLLEAQRAIETLKRSGIMTHKEAKKMQERVNKCVV